MTDIFTPEKRSWVMSRIRGTYTKIDLKMKKMLADAGYKFEIYPKMFGNPDFVLKRKKIIIFCDGLKSSSRDNYCKDYGSEFSRVLFRKTKRV